MSALVKTHVCTPIPIFVERRGDASQILLGYQCKYCGKKLGETYPKAA